MQPFAMNWLVSVCHCLLLFRIRISQLCFIGPILPRESPLYLSWYVLYTLVAEGSEWYPNEGHRLNVVMYILLLLYFCSPALTTFLNEIVHYLNKC